MVHGVWEREAWGMSEYIVKDLQAQRNGTKCLGMFHIIYYVLAAFSTPLAMLRDLIQST